MLHCLSCKYLQYEQTLYLTFYIFLICISDLRITWFLTFFNFQINLKILKQCQRNKQLVIWCRKWNISFKIMVTSVAMVPLILLSFPNNFYIIVIPQAICWSKGSSLIALWKLACETNIHNWLFFITETKPVFSSRLLSTLIQDILVRKPSYN